MSEFSAENASLLTAEEHEVMDLPGQVANKLHRIIKSGGDVSWPNDWNEAAMRIHAVQHTVMAQAAARAFPDRYRRLGSSFRGSSYGSSGVNS